MSTLSSGTNNTKDYLISSISFRILLLIIILHYFFFPINRTKPKKIQLMSNCRYIYLKYIILRWCGKKADMALMDVKKLDRKLTEEIWFFTT